ncbi:uncharacterized protein NPIL_129001 [Nephila pilipes]|uniref:Uncharacterized protein n=1 Tax=Nephila pilipes TaxID=299642 RepID=A0A8X6PHC4_NEPPI|nr:uncharacterized protein NPIL_129001 [Nephila pilipes]
MSFLLVYVSTSHNTNTPDMTPADFYSILLRTSHTTNPVQEFWIQTFGEEGIISKCCKFPWPPRTPDMTPADFWLRGYLKSRVYLSRPFNLSELNDAIRRELSCIQPDILHSAVAGFVTRLRCVISCGGGYVEHILL